METFGKAFKRVVSRELLFPDNLVVLDERDGELQEKWLKRQRDLAKQ